MTLYAYVANDIVIGVYNTLELAETNGKKDALDLFGVEGYVCIEDV
jgi:hypothetical protein